MGCGQVRGPVQLTFARSLDRVFSTEHGITRVAYTKEEKKASTTANTEMGRKHTVAYGLYLAHGFINPVFAKQTGFNDEDIALLWKALCNLFDVDRSAARGLMSTRGLFVFEHAQCTRRSACPQTFERLKIEKKRGIESPRSFKDYTVTLWDNDLPTGIKVSDLCAAYA